MSADSRAEITDLVAGFERDWGDLDAAIAHSLRPGISDAEMDALTIPLDIRLPDELRAWWGLHDGATTHSGGSRFTFNFAEWLSLEEAARATKISREVDAEMADDHEALGLPRFKRSFFVVMRLLGRFVVCDCVDTSLAPVYCLWPEEPWRLSEPVAPRYLTLLQWWREALDEGAYELRQGSLVRVKPVPPSREASGLM